MVSSIYILLFDFFTNTFAGIAPFYLYVNKSQEWLCPITLYAMWIGYVEEPRGYMFRKKLGGQFSQQPEDAMASYILLNYIILMNLPFDIVCRFILKLFSQQSS